MDFLGIGAGEILLIIILAFLIFETDKIPKMMEALGRILRQIKQASTQFVNDMIKETREVENIKKEIVNPAKNDDAPSK